MSFNEMAGRRGAGRDADHGGVVGFALTIGFSQVGHESDWRTAFSKSMQDEAKKEGIDLKFSDANQKEEDQLKAVRSFISQKVDAIVIAPIVVTGWDQVLKEAKEANIPVFIVDRDVDTKDKSLFVTRIAADFNLEGRLAGAWLARRSRAKATSSNCRARSVRPRPNIARRASRPFRPSSRGSRPSSRKAATSRPRAARR